MHKIQDQFRVNDNIIEIPLSGEKLAQNVNDLNVINRFGIELYKKNQPFIRENVPDTWYAAIEPESGRLIASNHPYMLYQYTSEKYPGKLVYVIGLLRDSQINFFFNYE